MCIYYTVYRTVNLINGKEYIGIHKTKNPNDGYLGSGYIMKKPKEKYQRLTKEINGRKNPKQSSLR